MPHSKEIIWASSSDQSYRTKAAPYVDSLLRNNITPTHYTVDYTEEEWEGAGVDYVRVESQDFKAPAQIPCIQHGEFLHTIEGNPTIVFTDSDIVCQRPLTTIENARLSHWGEGYVGVVYNNGEGDSLLQEAIRLQPTRSLDEIFSRFVWNRHPMYMPCYNTGVLVAKKQTYQRLYKKYCELYPLVDDCFLGYAKQQWLISYLLTSMTAIKVTLLGDTFHAHGCFNTVRPVPSRFYFSNNTLSVNDEVVLLRHNWMTPYFEEQRFI